MVRTDTSTTADPYPTSTTASSYDYYDDYYVDHDGYKKEEVIEDPDKPDWKEHWYKDPNDVLIPLHTITYSFKPTCRSQLYDKGRWTGRNYKKS